MADGGSGAAARTAETSAPKSKAAPPGGDAKPAGDANPGPVPGLDVTADPRWALGFLAKLYTKAKKLRVLNTFPGWIEPDSESLATVFDPTRNARVVDRRARDLVLGELVPELIAKRELPSSTKTDLKSVRALFRRETVLGTGLIERFAANWMLKTLGDQRNKVLRIFTDAMANPAALTRAAVLVVRRAETTLASIRDDDLYRVLYPKNRRARDGSTASRVAHVRYIIATRAAAADVQARVVALREVPADLGAAVRGLARSAFRDAAPRPESRTLPTDASLPKAFKLLEQMVWHPNAVRLVQSWTGGLEGALPVLSAAVNDSLNGTDKLKAKLEGDASVVWRFPPALRAAVAGLKVADPDSLTQYALVWASAVKPTLDAALDAIGNIATLLELFGGPLAPVGVIAGAIVQAVGAATAVLRQLDQDHAESATAFEKEADRLSTGGKYADAAVQAAGALLAATSVPEALGKILGKGERAAAKAAAAAEERGNLRGVGNRAGRENASDVIDDANRGLSETAGGRPPTGQIPNAPPASIGKEERAAGQSDRVLLHSASGEPGSPKPSSPKQPPSSSPVGTGSRGVPIAPAEEPLELLNPAEEIDRLSKEFNPEWAKRSPSKAKLPETTRRESPLKSLGHDKPRPAKGYFTRAVPKGVYRAPDFIKSLSQPELHHFWPKYLKGLPQQSLGELSGMLHDELHASLIKWKGGLFNYQKLGPGPRPYELLSPEDVFSELRNFYEKADHGRWKEYLPNFDKAAEETLRSLGKWPPP